jgi:transposase
MKKVELYQKVRRAILVQGMGRRAAAGYFGIDRKTVDKMLQFPMSPDHGRKGRVYRRKLADFTGIIDQILLDDQKMLKKQRHSGRRIFERLRDEHSFTGGLTIVREYLSGARLRAREVFVPLSHRPGHAQADFGEADAMIAGKRVRFHYLCLDLPFSDACFVKDYPAETAEAFCDGHVAAFAFFGGVHKASYITTPGWLWPRFSGTDADCAVRCLPLCKAIICSKTSSADRHMAHLCSPLT